MSAFVNSLPVVVKDIHISGNERTYNDFIERELDPIRGATTAGQLAKKAYEAVAVSATHTQSPGRMAQYVGCRLTHEMAGCLLCC